MIYEASKKNCESPQSVTPMEVPLDFSWDAWNTDLLWNDTEWGSIPGFNEFNFEATDFSTIDDQLRF